eukprot:1149402-Pelagomonas_calceolata.AAC.5
MGLWSLTTNVRSRARALNRFKTVVGKHQHHPVLQSRRATICVQVTNTPRQTDLTAWHASSPKSCSCWRSWLQLAGVGSARSKAWLQEGAHGNGHGRGK